MVEQQDRVQPPTFDIECLGWTDPIAVGFYDGYSYFEFIRMREEEDVVWKFLTFLKEYPGYIISAHNATDYDNKFILNTLQKNRQTVRFLAGLGKLHWVEADVQFVDSYLLLGRSLKVLCKAFGTEEKLDWQHYTTKMPWEMTDRLDEFRSYLKRDCVALSAVLEKFFIKIIDSFGITPSLTLSLTAVKAFDKRFYPMSKIEPNEPFEYYVRRATYGGRNEVYKRYGRNLNLYDVKGMYTSCYDVPIPLGKMEWGRKNIDKGTWAEAKVHVPEDLFIGPLPHRYNGRLLFPVGEFQDMWDLRELRNAAEKYKVDVTILRQLYSEEEVVLKGFGDYVSFLRQEDPDNPIWKLFGLRLSGKMGQSRWGTEIAHFLDIPDCTGWVPIDNMEIYHERLVYVSGKKSPYIKPAVNMRIRSEARIRHLNYLEEGLTKGDIFYCDTDSVYTTAELPTGEDSGTLQLIDKAIRAYFVRRKLYGYVSTRNRLIQRASGFRDFKLNEYDFIKLLEGGKVVQFFRSPGPWKSAFDDKVKLLEGHREAFMDVSNDNRISEGIDTRPYKIKEKVLEQYTPVQIDLKGIREDIRGRSL